MTCIEFPVFLTGQFCKDIFVKAFFSEPRMPEILKGRKKGRGAASASQIRDKASDANDADDEADNNYNYQQLQKQQHNYHCIRTVSQDW